MDLDVEVAGKSPFRMAAVIVVWPTMSAYTTRFDPLRSD
jgi:hypothetical protein